MIRSKPDHSARGRAPLPVLYVASLLAMSLLVLPTPVARAANSVTVGSVTASPGETGVTIPILLQNDVSLSRIVVPLVIREVSGGAYPTSLQLHLGDRMLEIPTEILQMNIDEVNGTCDIDGLGTVLHNDQESHPVTGPVGAMFLASRIFTWTLRPDADVTGSLLLTVDIGPNPGVFEVDVTCADSEGQLVFRDNFNNPVTPTFSKGIVSVGMVFQDGFETGGTGSWSSVEP